jgi:hypothetical protein
VAKQLESMLSPVQSSFDLGRDVYGNIKTVKSGKLFTTTTEPRSDFAKAFIGTKALPGTHRGLYNTKLKEVAAPAHVQSLQAWLDSVAANQELRDAFANDRNSLPSASALDETVAKLKVTVSERAASIADQVAKDEAA